MPIEKTDLALVDLTVTTSHTEVAPAIGTAFDIGYGVGGAIRIQNGGSAPNPGCFAAVQVTPDGTGVTGWRTYVAPFQGSIVAGRADDWSIAIPPEAGKMARVIGYGPGGASVTVSAKLTRVDKY